MQQGTTKSFFASKSIGAAIKKVGQTTQYWTSGNIDLIGDYGASASTSGGTSAAPTTT